MLQKIGRNAYKYEETNNVSKFAINPERSNYLLQNDVLSYFGTYWKRENVADINFWDFNKFND